MSQKPELTHAPGALYRPVGGYSLGFLLAVLIWALLGLPAAAYLYALGCFHSSQAALTFLFVVGFPLLHGRLLGRIARAAGCGSGIGLRLTAALLGLWSVYLVWVAWLYTFNGSWIFVFDPRRLLSALHYIAKDGFWEFGKYRVGYHEQLLYWGLEALAFLTLTPAAAWNALRGRPRCPRCGKDFTPVFRSRPLEFPAFANFRRLLRAGRFELLEGLEAAHGNRYLEIEIIRCGHCPDQLLLRVFLVTEALGIGRRVIRRRIVYLPPVYCPPEVLQRLADS